MTETQHKLLQFTLGLNNRKTAHRNCLATGPDEDTFPDVAALESAGFMYQGAMIPGGLTYFHATHAGVAAARCEFNDFQHLFTAIVEHALKVAETPPLKAAAPVEDQGIDVTTIPRSHYAVADRAAPVKVERKPQPAPTAMSDVAGYPDGDDY